MPAGTGICPAEAAGGQPQEGDRIGLDHVRRRTSGVTWTGNALNRTEWRNAYLHRSAGGTPGEFGQQRPDRITEQLTRWFAAFVQGLDGGLDRGQI